MVTKENLRVVALAGGVGGAKLVDGLAQNLLPDQLTVIVNVGDDFEHLGLQICPDLDTVCYTLAGLANPQTGWGRAEETWHAMESLEALGGPTWFRLGDRDLATHLERTRRMRNGQPLSRVTLELCAAWGVGPQVLPVTDEPVPTIVCTGGAELSFQEYFVRRRCEPQVTGFRFSGAAEAHPAPGVLGALQNADLILIGPSNPWVSIDPILAIPGIRTELAGKPVVAISPIIGGRAVKGPAAKMFGELGVIASAPAVAAHYGNLLTGFVMDRLDRSLTSAVLEMGVRPMATDTLMKSPADRKRLGREVLEFCKTILLERN